MKQVRTRGGGVAGTPIGVTHLPPPTPVISVALSNVEMKESWGNNDGLVLVADPIIGHVGGIDIKASDIAPISTASTLPVFSESMLSEPVAIIIHKPRQVRTDLEEGELDSDAELVVEPEANVAVEMDVEAEIKASTEPELEMAMRSLLPKIETMPIKMESEDSDNSDDDRSIALVFGRVSTVTGVKGTGRSFARKPVFAAAVAVEPRSRLQRTCTIPAADIDMQTTAVVGITTVTATEGAVEMRKPATSSLRKRRAPSSATETDESIVVTALVRVN